MAAPYELWQTHRLLKVVRATKPETWYFGQFFPRTFNSTDEYIDFEKLPIRNRKLAPFVLPLGRGRGVYEDSQRTLRFKPAYTIVEETLDPLRGLTFEAGIDESMNFPNNLTPMQRRELLRAAMLAEAMTATRRRWEWLGARAIIDGQVTLTGKDYPSTTVNFQRASGHTEALTGSACWGQAGVSILDKIQAICDTMNDAEFGAVPTRITMGGAVAAVVRKDSEILQHLDTGIRGGSVTVDRGVVSSGKVYKFGEIAIGGQSGQTIELWVNNETYMNDAGQSVRYLGNKEAVFTAAPSDIDGHQCFGMIVDEDAEYQALPLFPKNFRVGDDVKVEKISVKSSPLMVPINPDATYKLTPLD